MKYNLYNDDCLNVLKTMQNNMVDLVVTSPPYDNLRTYNNSVDIWNFQKFQQIAKELYRVIKDGGVIAWIVDDATINGSESGTSFKQALYFKEVGFNLHDTMIWQKTNPMPKIKTKRYFDCFEYMFILSKGQPKTFNPIMVDCKFGGKVYDSTCKNMGGENGRTKKTFILNNKRYKNNIWEIPIAQNETNHPAVFPLQIALDHIKSWSNKGDIVLDPFLGSGTTGIASAILDRNFIGIEINKEYFELSKNRIEKANTSIFDL